jgi:Tol biopolymer transport system component
VYRAHDSRLDREVAIKVLPESLATDRDRLSRFQREARLLASLNHPQIAQIHGVEESGGVPALVMELVEGPTLADRLNEGALPLDEALPMAVQIADALEAAHAQGIVHRDLKPANIKIRGDGLVKVLDFGLAKTLEPPASSAGASISPTLSLHATEAGIILGTAAYMAPEQARGKGADTRADIWAFGAVLFEMLSGVRPYGGDDVSETLAAVIKSEPVWDSLPGDTPDAIRRLLRRCLQKDRRQRLQHIGDARLELQEAQQPATRDAGPAPARPWRFLAIAATVGLLALTVGMLIGRRTGDAPDAPEMRLEISTPGGLAPQFALSPDGAVLAYATTGRRQIHLRDLASTEPRALAGTEGAEHPFWSPDGRALGFFANNKLKRVDVNGGLPEVLADVLTPAGGTWNRENVILYVPNDSDGVFQVSASGGESRAVTPDRQPRLAVRAPEFLPDGRRYIFYVARGGEAPGVYVGELGSDRIRRVLAANSPAKYANGHLWFVRDDVLVAQQLDPSTGQLAGPVVPIAEDVNIGLVGPNVSTSANGIVAYRSGAGRITRRQLVWFDRAGKELGTAGEEGSLASNPTLSSDGRFVVLQRTVDDNIDLWVIDVDRNVTTRLTDAPGIDSLPIWSPDATQVVFNSVRELSGLATLRIDRTRPPQRLGLPPQPVKIACDWSPDGRFILYKQFDERAGTTDLFVYPLEGGDKQPRAVAETAFDERDGQFSPDGKWVAYESNESGQPEIYMQPFPGPGAKVRVSVEGGTQVRWRADGREIFYIAADGGLVAAAVDLTRTPPFIGAPNTLFKTSIAPIRSISRQQYVVARDGQRFLVLTSEETGPLRPITLLLNWRPPAAR